MAANTNKKLRVSHLLLLVTGTLLAGVAVQRMVPWGPTVLPFPRFDTMHKARFPPFPATQITPTDIERGLLVTGSGDDAAVAFNISDAITQLTLASIEHDAACTGAAHFGIPVPAVVMSFAHPPRTYNPEYSTPEWAYTTQRTVDQWMFSASDVVSGGTAADQRFLFMLNPECTSDTTSDDVVTNEFVYMCVNSGLTTHPIVTKTRARSVLCTGWLVHPRNPTTKSKLTPIRLFKIHAVCLLNHYDLALGNTETCKNQSIVH